MAFNIQRKKQVLAHANARLRVGTHATCDLVLDDPLAADVHAIVHLAGQGLEVEAQPTSLGTYLDGRRIEGRQAWRLGSELILGATRLRFTHWDSEERLAEIEVLERDFYFVDKRRGEFRSDADEWVRSEVRFGRMPALRKLNALAGLLVLLGGLWLLLAPGFAVQQAISPGPLTAAHAEFFEAVHASSRSSDSGVRAGLVARWGAEVVALGAQGCNACHVEGSFATANCAGCHAEPMDDWLRTDTSESGWHGKRHPFQMLDGERSCLDCHREHDGGETRPDLPHSKSGNPQQVCAECHAGQSAGDLLPALADVLDNSLDLTEDFEPTVLRPVFQGFDHDLHFQRLDGASMDGCAVCHPRADTLVGGRESLAYFTEVRVAACLTCHHADAREFPMSPERRVGLTAEQHAAAPENCAGCHAEALSAGRGFDARLASTSIEGRRQYRFEIPPRPHAHEAGEIAGRACTDCHLRPIEGSVRSSERVPFSHTQHLDLSAPEVNDLSGQCRACHVGVTEATDFASAAFWSESEVEVVETTCNGCHRGSGGTGVVAVALPGTRALQERVPFDHALHAAGGTSCADCHLEIQDGRATFKAAAVGCAECHIDRAGSTVEHRHAGLDDCSKCHSGSEGQAPAVFLGDALARLDASSSEVDESRQTREFEHQSHSHYQCRECHVSAGAIGVARGMGGRCQSCHVLSRYHWRAPLDPAGD